MGLLDVFRSQWSGKDMTPDDRKKIFWYLKRKTSYTAWKREADAFDRFADIFEKQVIEEPAPAIEATIWGTDWEERYPEILKAQVNYEQALQRLLQGDRTIFLYNSLGILEDASNLAHYWYGELVNHGAQGDHFFDGKYVPAMTAALVEFYECSRDTGYFQPRMSDARAPHFWGEWMKGELARVCHRQAYEEVPVPSAAMSVNSGDEAPVFGIYEPQTKDGCMNYLCAGAPAPRLVAGDGAGRTISVTWRLVWQDERYLDGRIPDEEVDYFLVSGMTPRPDTTAVSEPVISVPSGTTCPRAGIWAVLDDIHARVDIEQGDTMPEFNGRDVTWVWTSRR